ncbi:hypothetical protein BCV70DRAFT_201393 [Testicularia cyperi]|uniref:1-phosphatidylinositol 4-kinase n=1 Tax=Testicularia cyperi TaxID=1882483 RepID=A0A317XMT4_9BASI|nr:hypothetical protein BCV70DRAFT_201393 [Testicularia cyperi]
MASLLLRLFHSDYFSPHLALSYLRTYSDNIGITYYLVGQLETAFPSDEVEFYWPQLCHLLITKPSESRALESFVLRRCSESVHVALLTLWYFQAALSDLSSNPHTASFHICQRVFNQCQRILFDDPLTSAIPGYALAQPTSSTAAIASTSSAALGSNSTRVARFLAATGLLSREKVSPYNPIANIVGIGSVLASTPGMPQLAMTSGTIAIEQARKKPDAMQGAFTSRAADEEGDDDDDDDAQRLARLSGPDDDVAGDDSSDNESVSERRHAAESSSGTAASASTTATKQPITVSATPTPPPAQESGFMSYAASLARKASSTMARSETAPPLPPPKDSPAPAKPSVVSPEVTSGGSLPTNDAVKKVENPFTTFAAGFNAGLNDFRDKAAAAVGEVFGQAQEGAAGQSTQNGTGTFASGRNGAAAPSPWSPSKHRQIHFGNQAAPSRSVPNLVTKRGSISSPFASSAMLPDSVNKIEAVLSLYDTQARSRLLRSNYCKVQTQFLLSLQDISARLLLIPKPARLSALRAELTALNHKLPADVCFPLWCTADDKHHTSAEAAKGVTGRHHKVVRINPSEAVVLNSADRVPFLLHVEVLNNDLDFDPDRRQNRETLRRLVTEEDKRRRKTAAGRGLFATQSMEAHETPGSSMQEGRASTPTAAALDSPRVFEDGVISAASGQNTPQTSSRPLTPALLAEGSSAAAAAGPGATLHDDGPSLEQVTEDNTAANARIGNASTVQTPDRLVPPDDDGEEMDLTEQAYGSDLAAFGNERRDSTESDAADEEDLASRNRLHDTAAWTYVRSSVNGAGSSGAAVQPDTGATGAKGLGATGVTGASGAGAATSSSSSPSSSAVRDFSLDEYAQRMRTAAIMLSQLNRSTNAHKSQAIVNYGPNLSSNAQGGWSSWIVPTNWYGSSAPAAGAGGGAGDKAEVGQGSAGVSTHVTSSGSRNSINSIRGEMGSGSGVGSPFAPMGGGGGAGRSSKLVHSETEAIRKRIMQEMMALEEERMRRMKAGGRSLSASRAAAAANSEDEEAVLKAVNKDDPSAAMFSESWKSKKQRIRASSPYGHLANWDVFSVIVKTGADLRQEQLAVQLINEFKRIWAETGSECWVRYFRILVTSENSGLMETITDAVSIHSIKKEAYSRMAEDDKSTSYSLYDHFVNVYGTPTGAAFGRAREKFMQSLAGYSIISYLLQIKDRHNGNILVDGEGRLIHIDFGFMLGISPGGVGFEAAPFKMPQEYIDILGGMEGQHFDQFKQIMRKGFRDVRKHAERIIMLVELMAKDSRLPCFALGDLTASNLRDRFQLALTQSQCDEFVDKLILSSAGSAFTRLYDMYQRLTEGVL